MKRKVHIESVQSELVMVEVQYRSIWKNISEFLTEIFRESRLRGNQYLKVKDNKIYVVILKLVIFYGKLGGTASKVFRPFKDEGLFLLIIQNIICLQRRTL